MDSNFFERIYQEALPIYNSNNCAFCGQPRESMNWTTWRNGDNYYMGWVCKDCAKNVPQEDWPAIHIDMTSEECPNCHHILSRKYNPVFCGKCGSILTWRK